MGEQVVPGQPLGEIEGQVVTAPIAGHLRGVARDGVAVLAGQRLVEVDPREVPQVFGLGERPAAVAQGVARALGLGALPGGGS